MIDFSTAIDWLSVKLTGITVAFAVITGSTILSIMAGIATATTIVYNVIRIIKEFKKQK